MPKPNGKPKNSNDSSSSFSSTAYYEKLSSGNGSGSASEFVGTTKLLLSKYDFELYDKDKAIPSKIFRIKRTGIIDKTEAWKVLEDNELKFIIEGVKLTKFECEFLRGVDGVNFLLAELKTGCNNIMDIKNRLKIKIKSIPKVKK